MSTLVSLLVALGSLAVTFWTLAGDTLYPDRARLVLGAPESEYSLNSMQFSVQNPTEVLLSLQDVLSCRTRSTATKWERVFSRTQSLNRYVAFRVDAAVSLVFKSKSNKMILYPTDELWNLNDEILPGERGWLACDFRFEDKVGQQTVAFDVLFETRTEGIVFHPITFPWADGPPEDQHIAGLLASSMMGAPEKFD